MKKIIVALSLCLMSVCGFAQARQMKTQLPSNLPSVNLHVAGENYDIKPTSAYVREKDANHVECAILAGTNKATVVLPIAFDTALDIALQAAKYAKELNIINEECWQDCLKEYKRLGGKKMIN